MNIVCKIHEHIFIFEPHSLCRQWLAVGSPNRVAMRVVVFNQRSLWFNCTGGVSVCAVFLLYPLNLTQYSPWIIMILLFDVEFLSDWFPRPSSWRPTSPSTRNSLATALGTSWPSPLVTVRTRTARSTCSTSWRACGRTCCTTCRSTRLRPRLHFFIYFYCFTADRC